MRGFFLLQILVIIENILYICFYPLSCIDCSSNSFNKYQMKKRNGGRFGIKELPNTPPNGSLTSLRLGL